MELILFVVGIRALFGKHAASQQFQYTCFHASQQHSNSHSFSHLFTKSVMFTHQKALKATIYGISVQVTCLINVEAKE